MDTYLTIKNQEYESNLMEVKTPIRTLLILDAEGEIQLPDDLTLDEAKLVIAELVKLVLVPQQV